LSSLVVVSLKGKLGAAFGSYGWSGEAVRMIEDRMRGLKMRVPVPGLRIKLIPNQSELAECRAFGRTVAGHLTGQDRPHQVIELADLG
jgi:flavorubredoxin